ncbi:YjbE family putative metal transport protein [Neobacillus drentensis]|uniref:YjbE family putative metal transport protein n=1 Tax=Neobacillus drentensis TaxID=220684 RepID=UPI0030017577
MTVLQILSLIGIDILLSGDNAVVIALAASKVPQHLRNRAIFGGTLMAIVLRILAATVLIQFLGIPFVQLVGGLILLRISYNLIAHKEEENANIKPSDQVLAAIKTIAIADFAMSIDNVIALSSVAEGILPIAIGILISIPIIIFGSKLLTSLMERFPIIVYAGAGLLTFAAGKMMVEDKGLEKVHILIPESLHLVIPIAMAIILVVAVFVKNNMGKEAKATI